MQLLVRRMRWRVHCVQQCRQRSLAVLQSRKHTRRGEGGAETKARNRWMEKATKPWQKNPRWTGSCFKKTCNHTRSVAVMQHLLRTKDKLKGPSERSACEQPWAWPVSRSKASIAYRKAAITCGSSNYIETLATGIRRARQPQSTETEPQRV